MSLFQNYVHQSELARRVHHQVQKVLKSSWIIFLWIGDDWSKDSKDVSEPPPSSTWV